MRKGLYLVTIDSTSSEQDKAGSPLPPIPRRNLPVLVGSAFLIGGAYTIFSALFQPLILVLGGSITVVGVMVSISELSMLIPMLIFGEYSDSIGRRLPMLIASLLLIVAGLLLIVANHWLILIIPVLLIGFGFSLNQPAANAATAESAPSNRRGSAFAYRSAGRLLAGVITSITGIYILRRGTIQNAFVLFSIFMVVNLGLVYFLLAETLSSPRPVSNLIQNLRKNIGIHPKLKRLYLYVVVLDTIAFGTGLHIIYGLLAEFQNTSSQDILLYTLLSSLAGGLCQFFIAGRVVDRTRKWAIVLSDSIAMPAVLLLTLFPGHNTFIIGFMMMGIASSFWGPAVHAFIADHVSRDRIASEFGKIWGFKGIVGIFPPIFGGILAAQYGYQAPLLVNVVVGFFTISIVAIFLDRDVSIPIRFRRNRINKHE